MPQTVNELPQLRGIFSLQEIFPGSPDVFNIRFNLCQGLQLPAAFKLLPVLEHELSIICRVCFLGFSQGIPATFKLLLGALPQQFMNLQPTRIRVTAEKRFIDQPSQHRQRSTGHSLDRLSHKTTAED